LLCIVVLATFAQCQCNETCYLKVNGYVTGKNLSSFSRYFHVNVRCSAADKQLLSQLRKTTGFPFLNCRKALEQSNNDLKQV